MSNLFFYAPFLLVPFAVQLAVLFATGKRFRLLRFAVPALTAAVCIIAIPLYYFFTLKGDEGILILLDMFAILTLIILCLILAALVLAGWGLAWLVYYLIRLIKRKASDPS